MKKLPIKERRIRSFNSYKRYRQSPKGKIVAARAQRTYAATENGASIKAKASRAQRARTRLKVLTHYSKGLLECACCSETIYTFLVLDHTKGGGNAHRRELKITGSDKFYAWIIRNNFPKGFRVLCQNCNHSLGIYGFCPHQT